MDWRQHLHIATTAARRGILSHAALVDTLGELARRMAVSAEELWVRSGRLTSAQLEELLSQSASFGQTHLRGLQQGAADSSDATPTLAALITDHDDAEPEPASSRFMSEAPKRRERYVVKRELGVGGMARVLECQDQELGRRVALKAVRADLGQMEGMAENLEREARLTARLEHPNIIPVYDAGRKATVGPYYVMRLVRQPSLETVLERLRAKELDTMREYGFGRLLRGFMQVCSAVEYAHDRGIIHCDLKPPNILLGEFGEVLVVDWGMARSERSGETLRLRGGTPGYMAPEQFLPDASKVDARTDVFALGAILYEITCLAPAFDPAQVAEMLAAAARGTVPVLRVTPPSARTASPSAGRADLDEICMTALALEPSARYPSARALGKAIEALIEGTKDRERRRRRAEQQANAGDELSRSYFDLLDSRPERIAEVEELRAAIAPHEGVERKRELWNAEDRVSVTDHIAVRTLQSAVAAYEQALDGVADHARAQRGLFELYLREAERAKARRNDLDRAYFEGLARRYRDPAAANVVDGTGSVTIEAASASAFVTVQRFEVIDRTLVGRDVASGETPLVCKGLPSGTYVALVGRGPRPTRQPFVIRPGTGLTVVVDVVAIAATSPEQVYVAGGTALLSLGGGELREISVPTFYIDAFPVTFAEYLAFLSELARGNPASIADHIPCTGDGEPYWEWAGDRFLRASAGMLGAAQSETLTWPVFGINLRSAEAYASWKSARTGRAYRLPTEAEWEKAARGIDGRVYPWGDAFDASLCKMRESRKGRSRPERPGSFRGDVSPYGVRDMAGGIAEWTAAAPPSGSDTTAIADAGGYDSTRVAVKGGAWCDWAADCEIGARRLYSVTECSARVGFRLVMCPAER